MHQHDDKKKMLLHRLSHIFSHNVYMSRCHLVLNVLHTRVKLDKMAPDPIPMTCYISGTLFTAVPNNFSGTINICNNPPHNAWWQSGTMRWRSWHNVCDTILIPCSLMHNNKWSFLEYKECCFICLLILSWSYNMTTIFQFPSSSSLICFEWKEMYIHDKCNVFLWSW